MSSFVRHLRKRSIPSQTHPATSGMNQYDRPNILVRVRGRDPEDAQSVLALFVYALFEGRQDPSACCEFKASSRTQTGRPELMAGTKRLMKTGQAVDGARQTKPKDMRPSKAEQSRPGQSRVRLASLIIWQFYAEQYYVTSPGKVVVRQQADPRRCLD
jgi:hypothetical protein